MKKKLALWKKLVIVVACLFALGGAMIAVIAARMGEVAEFTYDDSPFGSLKDGAYEGLQDNMIVKAKVSVDVAGGRMAGGRLLEYSHGPGAAPGVEALFDRVAAAQSLGVDVVSGATTSSKVILKAVEAALRKAAGAK